MKVRLLFVPPGGGEDQYAMEAELPELPRRGDRLTIRRPAEDANSQHPKWGFSYFIIRNVCWHLTSARPPAARLQDEPGPVAQVLFVNVEAEFADGPMPSPDHKEMLDCYRRAGKLVEAVTEF